MTGERGNQHHQRTAPLQRRREGNGNTTHKEGGKKQQFGVVAAFLPILWVELRSTSLLLGGGAWPFPSLGRGAFSPAPSRPVFFCFL